MRRLLNHSLRTKIVRWSVLLALIAGCTGPSTTTFTVECDQNGSCKVTKKQAQNGAAPQDFSAAASSASVQAYRLILNLPSDIVLNTSSPVQATLTATTDTGYTSSITVTLQPTTSTTAPVAPGDAVYTFLLPYTSAVANWASAATANANTSINVDTSIISALTLQGIPGTYTVTIQEITEQMGLNTTGSVGITDGGGSGGTGNHCKKACP